MHDPVLESHHSVCDKPQTRRGIERRLALLLSATELFWIKDMMLFLLMTLLIMRVVQKLQYINILAIKMVYSQQFAITAAKCSLKIFAYHFSLRKPLYAII